MLREPGAANATINRDLAFLKRAFNLGIKNEKIMRKPYIPQVKDDKVRSGFFEYAEFVAVARCLSGLLQASCNVCLLYRMAQRRDPVASLQPDRLAG
jgi:hypothetical protein